QRRPARQERLHRRLAVAALVDFEAVHHLGRRGLLVVTDGLGEVRDADADPIGLFDHVAVLLVTDGLARRAARRPGHLAGLGYPALDLGAAADHAGATEPAHG